MVSVMGTSAVSTLFTGRSKLRRLVLAAAFFTGALRAAAPPHDYALSPDASGDYRVSASFVNFNRDPLTIVFALAQNAIRQSMTEFGYSEPEATALGMSCDGPCTQTDYDRRLQQYYRDQALMTTVSAESGRTRVAVDVPTVVQRNRPRLRALAGQFDRLAQAQGYGPEETVGAMVAFVQTALPYARPPEQEGGRDILGFYPPPRALEAGFGDCDTKSALLAAILTNFPGMKMIGVHIPKHYLVGIARVPRQGDAFIEYGGEPFVLIEPSGPGWLPPGTIGATTQTKLNTMAGVRIDPLF